MASLVPCTECARHVRLMDAACPFCGALVAQERARNDDMAAFVNEKSLTRAAVMFMGVTALAACGKSSGDPKDPQPNPPPTNLVAPAYGPALMPPNTDAAVAPSPQAVPAYGPAPIATTQDAGKKP